MGKARKRGRNRIVSIILIMSMLLALGNISVAKEHGSNSIRRDAKAQFRKDAGEVSKSDKGKPKYVVYQKHGKDAGKVKE